MLLLATLIKLSASQRKKEERILRKGKERGRGVKGGGIWLEKEIIQKG